jgi:hypothetical protein
MLLVQYSNLPSSYECTYVDVPVVVCYKRIRVLGIVYQRVKIINVKTLIGLNSVLRMIESYVKNCKYQFC